MLASQRRDAILAELARVRAVRVADLVQRFSVSDMTARRDLEWLEARGKLRRVHGGAVSPGGSAEEPGFAAKREIAVAQKRAIAHYAAGLIASGSAIGISAGTTTWLLAEELRERSIPLSVVTNSTSVSDVLAPAAPDGMEVVLTGGSRTPSDALVGGIADRAIASLHVDQLFLGIHGMDPAAGVTTPNLAEAHTNAVFIRQARSLIVLADSSKWQVVGLAEIAALTQIDVLITDDGLPAEARAVLTDLVQELVVLPS